MFFSEQELHIYTCMSSYMQSFTNANSVTTDTVADWQASFYLNNFTNLQ